MKPRPNPLLRLTAALAIACAASAHAADLTWNAALPGTWNTSNTNWSGLSWNNGTPDNAIFNNLQGTVTLGEAITAGSLSFNTGNGATHELTLTGSNLSLGSVSVWGGYNPSAGGAGVDNINPQAYDQRLRFDNMTVNATGDMSVRRGMLYFNSATVSVGGMIKNTDAWSVFRSDSSTVTVTGGIDFSVIASQVELYGGTVNTPFIKVGDAAGINGTGGLYMGNGVTVVATQANSDFIQVYYNGNTGIRNVAYITSGGMTLDTSSYAVTVATVLNGNGSLTKSGSGTLTLNQSNSYTGGTSVSQGMLVLSTNNWILNNVGGGGVTVGSSATLRADNSVANQLNGLTLNGGTVDAINSGGNSDWGNFFLTGNVSATGTSSMNADIALRATNVDFNVASGGTLNVGGNMHVGYGYGTGYGSAATVSKSGNGTMVLSTTHTYTGATTVSAGKLKVTGSIASSDVTVNGGILASGSTGTVGNNVTVNTGATFAAGDVATVGAASVASNLNFSSGSIFDWDLTTGSNTYDTVSVAGSLNITSGAKFNVVSSTAFTDTFWDATHTWSDIFGGKAIDNFLVSNFLYSGSATAPATEGFFTVSGSSLTWTAVPEPTSALAGLLLTAGLLRRRRAVG
jgi:fibronectin-binding autotransporter adhesin